MTTTEIRNKILGMNGMTPSEHRRRENEIIEVIRSEYQDTSMERKAYRKMLKAMDNAERRLERIQEVDDLLGTTEW